MASHIGVPLAEYSSRSSLRRSRSHSTLEPNAAVSQQSQSAVERPPRPTHGRSQSYLSPIAPKPHNAATLTTQITPVEKAPSRLHLPGKHHLHRDRDGERRGHRYTQSEVEHQSTSRLRKRDEKDIHKDGDGDTDGLLPNLFAGLNAERRRAANANDEKPAHSHTRGLRHGHGHGNSRDHSVLAAVPAGLGLTRVLPSRSHRDRGNTAEAVFGDAYAGRHNYRRTGYSERSGLRRRATSDPKPPLSQHQQHQRQSNGSRNPIELDLERAERLKRQRKFTLSHTDVLRKDRELAEAEEEMRSTLEDINRAGIEITRRLDYGYYNLLEKAGNLVSTIQSFRSVAEQSRQLVQNFDTETERLDTDTRRRMKQSRSSFEERSERIENLRTRGQNVARKAEDLNIRLENARVVLGNWSKREDQVKKKWRRAWGGVWMTVMGVLVVVLAVGIGRGWWINVNMNRDSGWNAAEISADRTWNRSALSKGSAGIRTDGTGDKKTTSRLKDVDADVDVHVDIPQDVRLILEGIEERNRARHLFKGIFGVGSEADDEGAGAGDDTERTMAEGEDTLRILDEL